MWPPAADQMPLSGRVAEDTTCEVRPTEASDTSLWTVEQQWTVLCVIGMRSDTVASRIISFDKNPTG